MHAVKTWQGVFWLSEESSVFCSGTSLYQIWFVSVLPSDVGRLSYRHCGLDGIGLKPT